MTDFHAHCPLPVKEFASLGKGHVLVTEPGIKGDLQLGSKIQLVCMFSVWELFKGTQKVGHYLESGFSVENKSAYLLTFMESKRGKAETATTVLREDTSGLIVIDLNGAGALAISTKVSTFVKEILESQ